MDTAQQIEMYRRQYFQLVNPQRLQLPHLDVLRLPKVQESLYNKMFSGNHVSYLPHERYRFRVLKGLIDSLQKAFQDPEEDVRLCLHSSLEHPHSTPTFYYCFLTFYCCRFQCS